MDRDGRVIVGVALATIVGVLAALVVLLAQSPPLRPTAASQPSGCVTGCAKSPPTGTPPVASVPAPAPAPVVEQPAPAAVASVPQPASAPSEPAPVSSVVSPKVAAPPPALAAPPPAAPPETTPLDEAVTRAVGAVTAAVQQVMAIVTPHAMPAVPALPPGGIEPPSTG